jgi:hypothetical protein
LILIGTRRHIHHLMAPAQRLSPLPSPAIDGPSSPGPRINVQAPSPANGGRSYSYAADSHQRSTSRRPSPTPFFSTQTLKSSGMGSTEDLLPTPRINSNSPRLASLSIRHAPYLLDLDQLRRQPRMMLPKHHFRFLLARDQLYHWLQ